MDRSICACACACACVCVCVWCVCVRSDKIGKMAPTLEAYLGNGAGKPIVRYLSGYWTGIERGIERTTSKTGSRTGSRQYDCMSGVCKQMEKVILDFANHSLCFYAVLCHARNHYEYKFWRDPTPFTRTCASRMAHRLRQTSTIFRQVEIPLAHRRSKWTNSAANNSNISIYYAFNVQVLTTIYLNKVTRNKFSKKQFGKNLKGT